MTTNSDHDILAERLESIRNQIAKLESKIAVLKAEENETVIAQNVMARLTGSPKSAEPIDNTANYTNGYSNRSGKKRRVRPKGTVRPEGIPTMPDMIKMAITSAIKEGKGGLSPSELCDRIDKTWWPGVDPNSVKPTAWRLEQDDRLKKVGDKYTLLSG